MPAWPARARRRSVGGGRVPARAARSRCRESYGRLVRGETAPVGRRAIPSPGAIWCRRPRRRSRGRRAARAAMASRAAAAASAPSRASTASASSTCSGPCAPTPTQTRPSGIMGPIAAGLESTPGASSPTTTRAATTSGAASSRHRRAPPTSGARARLVAIASAGIPASACRRARTATDRPRSRATRPTLSSPASTPSTWSSSSGCSRRGVRGGSRYAHLMEKVAPRLTEEQIRDVADYYASLPTGVSGVGALARWRSIRGAWRVIAGRVVLDCSSTPPPSPPDSSMSDAALPLPVSPEVDASVAPVRCRGRRRVLESRLIHRPAGPLTEDGAEVDFPVELAIELAAVCNLACVMCPVPTTRRPKQLIDDDLFRRIVDQATGERGFMLLPQGFGESMLHKRWHHLLPTRCSAGCGRSSCSPTAPCSTTTTSRGSRSRVDAIVVSIDGVTAPPTPPCASAATSTRSKPACGGCSRRAAPGAAQGLPAHHPHARDREPRSRRSSALGAAPAADDELRINEYNDWAGKVDDHSAPDTRRPRWCPDVAPVACSGATSRCTPMARFPPAASTARTS